MKDKKKYFQEVFNQIPDEPRPNKLFFLLMYGPAAREGNGVMPDSFVVDVDSIDCAELDLRALFFNEDSFPS